MQTLMVSEAGDVTAYVSYLTRLVPVTVAAQHDIKSLNVFGAAASCQK